MKRIIFAAVSLLVAFQTIAQTSGLPARPRFQQVNVSQGVNVTGTGAVTTQANALGIDNNAGAARLYSYGANVVTPGTFEFHSIASDGSPDTIGLSSDTTGTWSVPSGAIVGETSGTFTVTLSTGCTTQPTLDFDYVKQGNIVTVWIVGNSGFPCTGNTTSFLSAAGQFPAAIWPTISKHSAVEYIFSDNGTDELAKFSVGSSGALTIYSCGTSAVFVLCSATAWVAAGSRNFGGGNTSPSWTYALINP